MTKFSDFERKVLRIAYNFQKMGHRPPTYRDWEAKTGRTAAEVRAALQKLADRGYLEWVDSNYPLVKVIVGWEVPYM